MIHEPLILTNVRCRINRAFPTDLSEMKRETGGQRYHVVAEAVRASVTIEVLKGGRTGEFQHGTYSFGNPIFSLYAIRNSKGIIPVRGIVQQADTGKGPRGYYGFSTRIRTHIFLGQRVRFDVPEKYRKFSKSITAFYEISTCDLYVVSAFNNSYLKPDDYLRLSFGLKFQIF